MQAENNGPPLSQFQDKLQTFFGVAAARGDSVVISRVELRRNSLAQTDA